MDWEAAFLLRPEFAFEMDAAEAKRLFKGRLKTARAYVKKKVERAATELELYHQDRLVYPPKATMFSGEPRWEGSDAQKFLKEDVGNGVHLVMSNTDFYTSRPAYQLFQKSTIDGHTFQEESTEKFLKQYRARYGETFEWNSDDGDPDEEDPEEIDDDEFDYEDEDEGATDAEAATDNDSA